MGWVPRFRSHDAAAAGAKTRASRWPRSGEFLDEFEGGSEAAIVIQVGNGMAFEPRWCDYGSARALRPIIAFDGALQEFLEARRKAVELCPLD